MTGTVAIGPGVGGLRQLLETEGYRVVSSRDGISDADVVVVSGMDEDLMGIQNTEASASIITAVGKDSDEILADIRRCLELR